MYEKTLQLYLNQRWKYICELRKIIYFTYADMVTVNKVKID